MSKVTVSPGVSDPEVRLLDVAAVLLREWKTILGATLLAVLLGAAFAWSRPRTYTASTVLLPMGEGGGSGGGGRAEAIAASMPAGAMNLGALGSASQKMISAVLESRSVKEQVVEQASRGQPEQTRNAVRGALGGVKVVKKQEDGSVTVNVVSTDPRLAARIANAYPGAVNTVVLRLVSQATQRKQRFLELQLQEARDRLVDSEQEMLRVQQRGDVTAVQEQAQLTVAAASTVQQSINEQELRVAQLRRTLAPEHPQLRAAEAELAGRRAQLRRITSGGGGGQLYVPLSSTTGRKVAAARLTREYSKNEAIYNSLMSSLTQARFEGNNNLPAVSVLDAAQVPSTPTGGSRKVILFVATFLGLCVGLAAAFAREQIRRMKRLDEESEPFFHAWDRFRSDISLGRREPKGNGRAAPRE